RVGDRRRSGQLLELSPARGGGARGGGHGRLPNRLCQRDRRRVARRRVGGARHPACGGAGRPPGGGAELPRRARHRRLAVGADGGGVGDLRLAAGAAPRPQGRWSLIWSPRTAIAASASACPASSGTPKAIVPDNARPSTPTEDGV